MRCWTLAVLACLAVLLATASAASAATNITVIPGNTLVNNTGEPNFTPTGPGSQVGADLINSRLNGGNNVTLDTSPDFGEAGSITVNAAINSSGTGDLILDADDPITQTASIAVDGLMVTTNTNDNVTLTNTLNDFNSFSTGIVSGLSVTDQDALSLGTILANSSSTFTAGGNVTQTAAMIVAGTGIFNVGSTNNVTLTNAGNDLSSFRVSSANDATVVDSTGLTLSTSNVSDDLTVTASGFVGQNAPVTVAGIATFSVGSGNNLTLTNAANDWTNVVIGSGNNVAVTDMDDLTFGASTVSGNLTASASGALTQTGPASVTGTTAATGAPVTLDNAANDFGGAVAVTSSGTGAASVADANDLTLGNSTSGGALTATADDDLTVPPSTTITASDVLRLVADDQNPTAPAIGTGGIAVGANAALTGSDAIRLYAARRGDNSIDGTATFNGSTFTPGTLFAHSDRERWGVYSPAGTVTAPFTFFYKDADASIPQIVITTPADGATYVRGQVVNADYSCTDGGGGTGVTTCAGNVPDGSPIDTATVGPKTFTVDAENGAGNQSTADVTYTVVKASPTLTGAASPNVVLGGQVSNTATLAAGSDPTGTITFGLYGPDDASCSGTPVFSDTKTVSGNGSYTSASFTPAQAGSYRWTASYSGDANNNAATTACGDAGAAVTVSEPPATNPPPAGAAVHAEVTVESRVGSLRRGRRARLDTGIVVRCPAGLPRSCGGSGRVTAQVPDALAARTVTLGKLGFAVRPGQSRRVIIRLTPRGARIIERVRRVRVAIRVTTRGRGGARVVTTRHVTVRIR